MRSQLSPSNKTAGGTSSHVEQAGALCIRFHEGATELLMISSRRTGLWGIPKGHMEPGEDSCTAAEREAFEEAGIRGTASRDAVADFVYTKTDIDHSFHLHVHVVDVHGCTEDFPEKAQRKSRWIPITAAADLAFPLELRTVLHSLQVAV